MTLETLEQTETEQKQSEAHDLLVRAGEDSYILLTTTSWLELQRFFAEAEKKPGWLEDLRSQFKEEGHSAESYDALLDETAEVLTALEGCGHEWDDVFHSIITLADDIVGHGNRVSTFYKYMDRLVDDPQRSIMDYKDPSTIFAQKLVENAKENQRKAIDVKNRLVALQKELVSPDLLDDGGESVQTRMQRLKTRTGGDGGGGEVEQISFEGLKKDVGDLNQKVMDLAAELKKDNKEYDKDVTIAATTPTYCWVPILIPPVIVIPAGLIAASIVAGIYGDKAVKLKKRIDEIEAELATTAPEVRNKTALLSLISTIDGGLGDLLGQLDDAGETLDAVQRVWGTIAADHEELVGDIQRASSDEAFQQRMALKDTILLWKLIREKADFFRQSAFIEVESEPAKFAA